MPNNLGLRILLGLACIFIIIGGLKLSQSIVVPFILSIFISILVSPAIYWLNRKGVPTGLGILLVIGFVAVSLYGITVVVTNSVRELTRNMPTYQQNLESQLTIVYEKMDEWGMELPWNTEDEEDEGDGEETAEGEGGVEELSDELASSALGMSEEDQVTTETLDGDTSSGLSPPSSDDEISLQQERFADAFAQTSSRAKSAASRKTGQGSTDTEEGAGLFQIINPGTVLDLVSNVFTSLATILTNGFLILLMVVFILLEASSFPDKLRAIMPNAETSLSSIEEFAQTVFSYFAIKSLTSAATGAGVALWLALYKIDFAIILGLLAFFLNYIPNIGSLIAAVPAVLLAFVQYGPAGAIYTIVGYLIFNNVVGNFLEPKLMGQGLGLSTLVVFLSLVFWGWVLGPVGMLLSAPLTMMVKIALQSHPDTNWVAVLLSSGKSARSIRKKGKGKSKEKNEEEAEEKEA